MSEREGPTVDVAVVGAGLAGVTAAVELRARGLSVVVLEARERLGGRGYCRPFRGDGDALDFGGSWITPWQRRIRALCDRHEVALRPRYPVTARRWFRDGALHADGPAGAGEHALHDAAVVRMAADAALVADGDDAGRGSLSLAAYLDTVAAPPSTRDLVSAWWTVTGNGDKERVPVSELLTSMAHGDGTLDGVCRPWADTLEGGVSLLVERMVAASRATVRVACPVRRVVQDASGVRVDTATGEHVTARGVVLATGVNPLRSIVVEPPLSPRKRATLGIGHLGRAVKVWAEVRGVPVGVLATGGGRGVEWMLAERETSRGTTLLVGFGVADGTFEIGAEAQAAVARLFPEADLLGLDWHDWNGDPYAQGTWVAAVVGAEQGLEASTWHGEGRLAFASADIAPQDAGWFEGAVVSGELAATAVADALASA